MTIDKRDETKDQHPHLDLDAILIELGSFGKYQKIYYVLICIPILLNAAFTLGYIFEAGTPSYRCQIPECEGTNISEQDWLKFAVPLKHDSTPHECLRYASIHAPQPSGYSHDSCSASSFNTSEEKTCQDFVYQTKEVTIMNEWNITCHHNHWKLTIVGTINNIGQFFCLPLTGYVSDKYGRRTALVISLVMGGIFGVMRSLSLNYSMYLILVFLDTLFSASSYMVAFVLGMEFLQPENRILGGVLISCCYALGGIVIGIVAYAFQNWRYFLLSLYIPPLFGITLIWLLPESLRWLQSQSRFQEIEDTVRKAAKINGISLSPQTISQFEKLPDTVDKKATLNERSSTRYPLVSALKSVKLMIRLTICSFCWLVNTFVYYGLNLKAVNMAGNKYVNFILSNTIEVPGHLMALVLANKLGRRWAMCSSMIVAGLSCIVTELVAIQADGIRLALYLIGKFMISVSFTIVYVFTAELFPTVLRNSLCAICSMIGRFGSIAAPQMPLLATVSPKLPMFLFGGASMLAGVFSLTFPETDNAKLPDTIAEAVNIGTDTKEDHGNA